MTGSILTLFIVGLLIFFLSLLRGEKKIVVLFLNDYEWRGGGGFITMSCEIRFHYGIPRGFRIHDFTQINSYGEPSSGVFKTHLAPTMFFRDANYSLFSTDNFLRLSHFYTHSLHTHPPCLWVQVPFSFVEYLLPRYSYIQIGGRKIERQSLFRSFSDLTGDNHLPPTKRKEILKQTIPKLILGLLHPYYFIRAIILGIQAYRKSIILIWKASNKTDKPSCYLGLCENNLKGRKTNRFLTGDTHYILHIEEERENMLIGSGYIDIRRSSFSDDQFPYGGVYKCSFTVEASSHFQFLGGTGLIHEAGAFDTLVHRIPFSFALPKGESLEIIRQLNTPRGYNTQVSVYTNAFYLLPKTSLHTQHDHWHHQSYGPHKKIKFSVDAQQDNTPIRMTYRYVIDAHMIEIRFQKPIQLEEKVFEIFGHETSWTIDQASQSKDKKSIFLRTLEPIPLYKNKQAATKLSMRIKGLSDIQGNKYYTEEAREIWLPWREKTKNT